MKKLLVLGVLLVSIIGFGQKKTSKMSNPNKIYLIPSDIERIDTLIISKERDYIVNSGTDKYVKCKIDLITNVINYKKTGFDNINIMVMTTNIFSKSKSINPLTYKPIKILLHCSNNIWRSTIEYHYQNDYGVTKLGKISYVFDENYQTIDSETLIYKDPK